MNCEIKSKICLSLKSLDNIDIVELSNKTCNIEFRLDFIDFYEVLLLTNLDRFNRVILKITNYEQLSSVLNLFKHLPNLYIDIDFDLFEISKNILKNCNNLIISKHNIDLNDYNEIISRFQNLSHLNNISIIKLIFNERPNEHWKRKKLISIYQDLQINSNASIISFIEGEKSTFWRLYSLVLGAPFIYCGLDESSLTGKGQLTLNQAYKYMNLLWSFKKND